MESRGIPTVMICTDEFRTLARHEADSLGMPELPLVPVAHPLGGQQADAIRRKAEAALAAVAAMFTIPTAEFAQPFLGKIEGAL